MRYSGPNNTCSVIGATTNGGRQNEVVSLWGSPFGFDRCHGKSEGGWSSSQSKQFYQSFYEQYSAAAFATHEHQTSPPITPKQTATSRKTWPSPSICQPPPWQLTRFIFKRKQKGTLHESRLLVWSNRLTPHELRNKYIKKQIRKSLKAGKSLQIMKHDTWILT